MNLKTLPVIVVSVWLVVLGCVGSVWAVPVYYTFETTSIYDVSGDVTSASPYIGLEYVFMADLGREGISVNYQGQASDLSDSTVVGTLYTASMRYFYTELITPQFISFDSGLEFLDRNYGFFQDLVRTDSSTESVIALADGNQFGQAKVTQQIYNGVATFDIGSTWILTDMDYYDNRFRAYATLTAVSETAPVPEPTTILLFSTGLAGLIGGKLRNMRKR